MQKPFSAFLILVCATAGCASWRGRHDECDDYLGTQARYNALASHPSPGMPGDRGRVVVRLVSGYGTQGPLEDASVLALLRSPNGKRTDTVRFNEKPGGNYSALLPAGVVHVAALRIGYERYRGTVSSRPGYADTVTLVLRAAIICLESSKVGDYSRPGTKSAAVSDHL